MLQLVDFVPKKKTVFAEERYESDELVFISLEEKLKRLQREIPLGKILLLTDGATSIPSMGRTVVYLLEKDVLPLFALGDDIACVIACGGAQTLISARYFASLRRIRCVLFPCTAADADGAFARVGRVFTGGIYGTYPLDRAEVCCDLARVSSLSAAYARILLYRLTCFEIEAVSLLTGAEKGRMPHYAEVDAFLHREEITEEEIISLSWKIPLSGDCRALLAHTAEEDGEWHVFVRLLSLYSAFIRAGKPRRYLVPRYEAGEHVPTVEEFGERALRLERFRGELHRRVSKLLPLVRTGAMRVRALGGKAAEERAFSPSQFRAVARAEECGLCAVIRDFGLLEGE